MKTCFKCGEKKPVESFYRHPCMADGRLGKCIECTKADVRRRRAEAVDYYREYDRKRADDPKRVAARRQYAAEHKGRRDQKLWRSRNVAKARAHTAVQSAIKAGTLIVTPCARCGFGLGLQAHHEDYTKPLDVTWLCPPCHGQRHREINEERRQTKRAA